MALDVDVVVVGAGPTGLVIANLLGQAGVGAVLVERNATTVQEPRAVSIDDESMRTMQAIGVDDELLPLLARGYGSHYRGPGGSVFATVEPTSTEFGFEKRNAFQQPELEEILRKALVRHPSLDVRFGCEVASIRQDEACAWVAGTDRHGKTFEISARYVVGADGARSLIRKSIGAQLVGSSFEQRWLIVDIFDTRNRFRHTEVFCDPRRPGISLPGPRGTRRYEFMLHPHEDEELAERESFVRNLLGSVGPDADAKLRRVKTYLFHARVADRWRKGRIFLAGDAAHLSPPFAGQGMNSGIRDAHNLAWKLAEAIRRRPMSDAFLDSYQAERLPHAQAMVDLALSMGAVMMPRSTFRAVLTRAAFRLLGLYPPARNYVSQMRYKPRPRFEAGLLWPDGRGSRSIVGRLFPQPLVEDPAGRRMRLDDVLPAGMVVLLFGVDPQGAASHSVLSDLAGFGVPVVGITPEWMNPTSGSVATYRDVSRGLSELTRSGYLDHAMLLRPDRYVAATAPFGRSEALRDAVTALYRVSADAHVPANA